jgi:hypothetical protein
LTAEEAKTRAEAAFTRKESQVREGSNAMADYQAARTAEAEKTVRLRALRLARDAEAKTQQATRQPNRRSRANRGSRVTRSPRQRSSPAASRRDSVI